LEGCFKYFKFFRFRTPARLKGYGVRENALWCIGSLRLIDFSRKTLIAECIRINTLLPGAFPFPVLEDMSFDDYDFLYEIVDELIKERNKE
jgi:hypothetical protein